MEIALRNFYLKLILLRELFYSPIRFMKRI
jgi:hypothetical protein